MTRDDERQLTVRDSMSKLGGLSQAECAIFRSLGLSHIGDFEHVSIDDLEGAGIEKATIETLNESLREHGFNEVL